jgi:2,3-bisphosphoglycerate-dependent phosphoglycerate mutase
MQYVNVGNFMQAGKISCLLNLYDHRFRSAEAFMIKQLYIVRHCQAEGQAPEAQLTAEGRRQAASLVNVFQHVQIDRIVSSPFVRAVETIRPLARFLGIEVERDERFAERVLAADPMPDWLDRLRDSFVDMDLCFAGGESSRTAMGRAVSAVRDILRADLTSAVIVTHGALMTLLLKHFDDRFGFAEWQQLTNPDVYLVTVSPDKHEVQRMWK